MALPLVNRYQDNGYVQPLLIIDLATGEKAGEALLPIDAYRFAFHPSQPMMTAVSGQTLLLISLPAGGVLSQTTITDSSQPAGRRLAPVEVQFNRRGDLLATVLGDLYSGREQKMFVQCWDLAVASAGAPQTVWNGPTQDFRFVRKDAVALAGTGVNRSGVRLETLGGAEKWETQDHRATGGFDPSGKHFVQALPDRADIYDAATGKLLLSVSRKWTSTVVGARRRRAACG